MRTVYTTLWPDRPLQVEDAEYADLAAQGLLVDGPPPVSPHRSPDEEFSIVTDAPAGANQGG